MPKTNFVSLLCNPHTHLFDRVPKLDQLPVSLREFLLYDLSLEIYEEACNEILDLRLVRKAFPEQVFRGPEEVYSENGRRRLFSSFLYILAHFWLTILSFSSESYTCFTIQRCSAFNPAE